MISLLIPTFLIAQITVKQDKLCVVVSGKKHDHNNFLDEELFTKGGTIADQKCYVFGSWKKAAEFARNNLKREGKLLIVQGAHGEDGGIYHLNDGDETAEGIFTEMKNLSKLFHVGSVIHSCNSAVILNKKLMDDELSSSRLDKLCLISSSSFGRITYSRPKDTIQELLKMEPGENLEKPFSHCIGGLISSVNWSDMGLPEYLTARKTGKDLATSLDMGFKILENMHGFMQNGAQCNTLGEANLALCMSPNISDEIYSDMIRIMNPALIVENKKYFLTNLKNDIKKLEGITGQNQNKLECKKGILNSFTHKFDNDLTSLRYYPQVREIKFEIESEPFYKTYCKSYLATLKNTEDDIWIRETLITGALTNGMQEYYKSKDQLQRKYTKRTFDEKFDVFDFANATLAEKKTCSLEERPRMLKNKKNIISSVFGDSFFDPEYNGDSADEMLESSVSTQHVLIDYQLKSIKKESFNSPKDIARRKACRDFKF